MNRDINDQIYQLGAAVFIVRRSPKGYFGDNGANWTHAQMHA